MMNEDGKPRFQFGIRTLLMLIFLSSMPLAWVAYDVNKSRQRNAIEREWNRRGAQINFAPDRRIVWLGYRADATSQISDEELIQLQEAPRLQHLDLRNTAITDYGLVHLQQLSELYGLYLSGTAITDDGLLNLDEMTQLRVLDLTNTQVSANGIARLRKALPQVSIAWDGKP